ncbi:MAG: glutathione S-transferase N-terminal domain-containing protein [Gammaproteobacteria bacterium]|nr:glutathione S-transferase N-terminal domain-containing protein [Gammaproteobacteria bacterium]
MLDQYRNQPWLSKRCRILDFEINQSPNDIELIGYKLCPFTQRINIILNEKNIPHKITYIDILNKPEWFTKISPLQEIPILSFNNKVIFKSNVICEFLNDELGLELYPKQNIDTANSRAWIEFGNALIMDIYSMSISSNKKEYDDRVEFVYKKLDRINTEIKISPYFYGKTFTMIDTCYAPILTRLKMLDQLYKTTLLDDFENLKNWRYALTQKNSISSLYNENYLEDLHNFLIKKNSYIANKEEKREQI